MTSLAENNHHNDENGCEGTPDGITHLHFTCAMEYSDPPAEIGLSPDSIWIGYSYLRNLHRIFPDTYTFVNRVKSFIYAVDSRDAIGNAGPYLYVRIATTKGRAAETPCGATRTCGCTERLAS